MDDISCAIIHLAPLGPVDRSAQLRSPLARAASCNDEANALCSSWARDSDRNPSHHAPRRYFSHLYPEGAASGDSEQGEGSRGGGGGLRRLQSEPAGRLAAAAAAQSPQPPRLRSVSFPQHASAAAGPLSRAALDEEQRFLAGAHGGAAASDASAAAAGPAAVGTAELPQRLAGHAAVAIPQQPPLPASPFPAVGARASGTAPQLSPMATPSPAGGLAHEASLHSEASPHSSSDCAAMDLEPCCELRRGQHSAAARRAFSAF